MLTLNKPESNDASDVSIMVVDDSEPERFLARRIVKRAAKLKPRIRTDILTAEDGQEALHLLQNTPPQANDLEAFPPTLILLDINMPRMGGFEFLEAFTLLRQQDSALSQVVVTMFTSSSHEQDRSRALAFDCVKDYIEKPLSEERLITLIDTHLG